MPALAEKYTVFTPNMSDYGDSNKPEAGYDGLTLSEDFCALVQHLNFNKIALAAHDMSAPLALIYAGRYPNEVEALIYLDEPVLLSETIQYILNSYLLFLRKSNIKKEIKHGKDFNCLHYQHW